MVGLSGQFHGVELAGPCLAGSVLQSSLKSSAAVPGTGTASITCDRKTDDGASSARFYILYGFSGQDAPNCVALSASRVHAPDAGCTPSVSAVPLPSKGGTTTSAVAHQVVTTSGFTVTLG